MKISKIYNLSNNADLTQSVKLMSEQFHEFEKDRKEKEKIRNILMQEVNGLKESVKSLEKVSDDHEQYSRRNCY